MKRRAGSLAALTSIAFAACVALYAVLPVGWAYGAELPDGRVYEQVTPEEKYGSEAYQPMVHSSNAYNLEYGDYSDTQTEYTFQAAAGGPRIAYVAGPSVSGNENQGFFGGNEYVSTRTAAGVWRQQVLAPEGAPSAIFQAFSPNLEIALVNSTQPLSSTAPGFGESLGTTGTYDDLYSLATAGSEYLALSTIVPPYRAPKEFGTAANTFNKPRIEKNAHRLGMGFLVFEGASADYSHLLFAANDALTEASEGRPAAEGGAGSEFEKENNLYEELNGRLVLVNVLPNGETHANAGFGSGEPLFSHVISADGSRVFWTDLSTGHLYVREDGVRTVEISPEGTYQTATSDGSTVFYTNGDLYAYEVESEHTTDLTPGVAVEKVVGASEDGQYVYYVTGAKELMLWHDGSSTLITDVSPGSAEVTPDGHSIVFTASPSIDEPEPIDVYDATTETLHCASCTSYGTLGMLPMTSVGNVQQPRWITTNGDHVFFVSLEGLVPQDSNMRQDVYEWTPPGVGGCTESAGCVYLLSGGTSTAHSSFLGASENGEDVFIVTRANLVGTDEDGLYDVYDVRTGREAPVPPACTGAGCQGVPPAPPTFETPSTLTFSGVGNLVPKAEEATHKHSSRKAERQRKRKLRKALARCRRQHRHKRRQRRTCERRARHRYGAKAARRHGAKAARRHRGGLAGHRQDNGRGK